MYSREEAANIRKRFWISFGKYMKPILGASGESTNWINYRTGVKDLYFKLYAEQKYVMLAIELQHADGGIRSLYYEQFEQFTSLMRAAFTENWIANSTYVNQQGREIATFYCRQDNLSVYNEAHWPAIITFLKKNLIELDSFWQDVKPVFDDLA